MKRCKTYKCENSEKEENRVEGQEPGMLAGFVT